MNANAILLEEFRKKIYNKRGEFNLIERIV